MKLFEYDIFRRCRTLNFIPVYVYFRMGDEAAEELEFRLKRLVSAFSDRTKRTKEKIAKPPTPSISDSEGWFRN